MSIKDLVNGKSKIWLKLPWRKTVHEHVSEEVIETKEDLLELINRVNKTGVEFTLTEKSEKARIGLSFDPDTGAVTLGYKGKIKSKTIKISPPAKGEDKPIIDITDSSKDAI